MTLELLTEDDIDAIRAVSYCCSTDDARPQLQCVQLCDGWVLGTDSYRCALAELPDFPVSPIPRFVSPLALPHTGSCRVECVEEGTVTRTVLIDGEPWPIESMRKLDIWPMITGRCVTGRVHITDDGRRAVVEQLGAWWKNKTLKRDDGAAVRRTPRGIELSTRDERALVEYASDEVAATFPAQVPMVFNSRFFAELLTYAPCGAVDIEYQGIVGAAVIQADDEIHALLPIRTLYDVRWPSAASA